VEPVTARGDYVDGRFVLPSSPRTFLDRPSPADLTDHPGRFPVSPEHVSAAVAAARRVQPAWEAQTLKERVAAMNRLKASLEARAEALALCISREVGKPLWESRAEVRALSSKIDITLSEGLALVQGFTLEGGKLETRYRPHGVLAVLGPFNFPLHLAHGHIVPALVTGNAVVFKPSDVAPATAQLYAECIDAAGLPPGLFNLVQGGVPEGAALADHPDVDGLLFTGSRATGERLLERNAHRPGRLLALELGGKNAAVVLDDAPLEKTVHDVLFSALATAGQRCTAVSRVVVERGIADRFIGRLLQCVGAFPCGVPWREDSFHGPLATAGALERFLEAQRLAEADGHETLLAATRPKLEREGHYVTASIHRIHRPNSSARYESEELFGPDLAILVADDLEEACALANATPYGLAAGVFTQREASFEACAARLKVGSLAWNQPTVGASSRLPFGGVKASGNHRPAGLFSTLYCTHPQAVSRGSAAFDPRALGPAIRWPQLGPA
jgi:succinylglutamic semialdehyde dehydrogenase